MIFSPQSYLFEENLLIKHGLFVNRRVGTPSVSICPQTRCMVA